MNALLAFSRTLLAHREKVVLGLMMLLCATLAMLALRPTEGASSGEEELKREDLDRLMQGWSKPRSAQAFPKAHLTSDRSWDEASRFLDKRSPFRPGAGSTTKAGPVDGGGTDWPAIVVRQVSQPTPGGQWIAQVSVAGKAYVVREGRDFYKKEFELVRIDKTRLCVEVLRRLDDEVREFCKE